MKPRVVQQGTKSNRHDSVHPPSSEQHARVQAQHRQATRRAEAEAYSQNLLSRDPMAEQLGQSFVAIALSGEDLEQDIFDQVVPEEVGGPFIETDGGEEFARGTDESNPRWSRREPFPKT